MILIRTNTILVLQTWNYYQRTINLDTTAAIQNLKFVKHLFIWANRFFFFLFLVSKNATESPIIKCKITHFVTLRARPIGWNWNFRTLILPKLCWNAWFKKKSLNVVKQQNCFLDLKHLSDGELSGHNCMAVSFLIVRLQNLWTEV